MKGQTALCFLLASGLLQAQAPPAKDQNLAAELEDLLNTPITVASTKAMTIRESPGIITVFNREEIVASGAKDLLDVLRLVPGFEIGTDTQGVTSVFVRGIWGHEGKVLIRVDGQEANELRFACLYLGNSFLTETVQRIEIIRGPGSATYGGFAELAVVNIVTRGANELKGASGSVSVGKTPDSWGHQTLSASYGDVAGDFKYSVAAVGSRGNRSDQDFISWDGVATTVIPLKDNVGYQNDTNINVGVQGKGLGVRFIEDRYATFDYQSSNARMEFNHRFAEVNYAWAAAEGLTLTPKLNYKRSQGWFYPSREATGDKEVTRITGELQGLWDLTKDLNLVFGGQSFRDEGVARGSGQLWDNGKDTITYTTKALYAQALWNTPLVNVTLGGRYEDHSSAGSAFVPRFGLTKVMGRFHAKLLVAKAFRTPVIENLEGSVVHPEKTTAYEVEVGYQLTPQMLLTVNGFSLRIQDPIVFGSIAATAANPYTNLPKTGSRGLESTLAVRGAWGYLNVTGAYYQANSNQVPDYAVPQNDRTLLGAPRLKLTAYANVILTPSLSLAPSVIRSGSYYAYDQAHALVPGERDGKTILNVFANYRWQGTKLLASLGVANLTDAKLSYGGGYISAPSPNPAQGREVTLRLGYNF
ncbi:TonB-dependent siderophore receptor [Geothrix sp. PMB-07]|uniref:TonB-dependent receptor plug domain-containing protein n=1 Tax=Geothrix sp. PMB-07 TaxID=3068640 RepID=UPI0027426AA5|nr:TonB-dependent receptor plug domain-containing protein [Geothrix sp. PMB-07]WLT33033.1 TonB-dependent receptor plug domain-containing protein [Geothrix sp. PMB-07]